MRPKVSHRRSYLGLIKMSLLGVGGVLLLVIGVGIAWGYHSRQWDGQTRYTKIYLSPHLVIKSFDPKSHQGVILNFPDALEIESLSGRGSWKAGVIAQAGTWKWAADSVANYLGISYVGVAGNLGWWDELQGAYRSKDINWTDMDLADSIALERYTTPDGTPAYKLSRAWDGKAKTWFFDESIENKLLGVAVVNTTTATGLGASASRVVESMGYKVRSLNTVDEEVTKCILKTLPELRTTVAVRKLQNTFDCDWQKSQEQDLTLILGDQYRSWKTGD